MLWYMIKPIEENSKRVCENNNTVYLQKRYDFLKKNAFILSGTQKGSNANVNIHQISELSFW